MGLVDKVVRTYFFEKGNFVMRSGSNYYAIRTDKGIKVFISKDVLEALTGSIY